MIGKHFLGKKHDLGAFARESVIATPIQGKIRTNLSRARSAPPKKAQSFPSRQRQRRTHAANMCDGLRIWETRNCCVPAEVGRSGAQPGTPAAGSLACSRE